MTPLCGKLIKTKFTHLAIGDEFSTGRFYGTGIKSNIQSETIFRKVSRSEALPVKVADRGMDRWLSTAGTKPFSAMSNVWIG